MQNQPELLFQPYTRFMLRQSAARPLEVMRECAEIRAKATIIAAVVIVSANELSIGITKLSGFQPRLKVKNATE